MTERWTPTADGTRWNRLVSVEPDPAEQPDIEVCVTKMDPHHPSIPTQVKRIYELARAHGWDTWVQYSKVPRKRVNPVRWEQVSILAVCAQRPGQRTYVAWEYKAGTWSAESAFLSPPWRNATQLEVKEVLSGAQR